MMLTEVLQYIQDHEQDFVERLKALLSIPSISTSSTHVQDIRRACEYVKNQFLGAGLETAIWETSRHPAVFADTGPRGGTTLLVYGHYDVQPPGDLALWQSPPFEPTIRDGAVYARGSADDKGQMLCHVMALEAWMRSSQPPVRVKFLIEGEEEIGSPNLEEIVREKRERLACDVVVISDTSKFSSEIPAITYGTRGLVYKDVKVFGPARNIHSGVFGGTQANPGNVIAGLIAGMRDADNRVLLPGFYDDVSSPDAEELEKLRSLPFDTQAYLANLGSPKLDGEQGYSTLERRWLRPTLDVNGLYGGYMEEGAMTVIPSMCGAKISMRLVPDQDPQKISSLFDDYVRNMCPDTVRLKIDTHGCAAPYATPLDLPVIKAAEAAIEKGFGTRPTFIREGGTIPIMALFKKHLDAESVLMGFAHPNCNLHGPDEFLHVTDYLAGIRSSACFVEELGRLTA